MKIILFMKMESTFDNYVIFIFFCALLLDNIDFDGLFRELLISKRDSCRMSVMIRIRISIYAPFKYTISGA
jgi:hypothetical protein